MQQDTAFVAIVGKVLTESDKLTDATCGCDSTPPGTVGTDRITVPDKVGRNDAA